MEESQGYFLRDRNKIKKICKPHNTSHAKRKPKSQKHKKLKVKQVNDVQQSVSLQKLDKVIEEINNISKQAIKDALQKNHQQLQSLIQEKLPQNNIMVDIYKNCQQLLVSRQQVYIKLNDLREKIIEQENNSKIIKNYIQYQFKQISINLLAQSILYIQKLDDQQQLKYKIRFDPSTTLQEKIVSKQCLFKLISLRRLSIPKLKLKDQHQHQNQHQHKHEHKNQLQNQDKNQDQKYDQSQSQSQSQSQIQSQNENENEDQNENQEKEKEKKQNQEKEKEKNQEQNYNINQKQNKKSEQNKNLKQNKLFFNSRSLKSFSKKKLEKSIKITQQKLHEPSNELKQQMINNFSKQYDLCHNCCMICPSEFLFKCYHYSRNSKNDFSIPQNCPKQIAFFINQYISYKGYEHDLKISQKIYQKIFENYSEYKINNKIFKYYCKRSYCYKCILIINNLSRVSYKKHFKRFRGKSCLFCMKKCSCKRCLLFQNKQKLTQMYLKQKGNIHELYKITFSSIFQAKQFEN